MEAFIESFSAGVDAVDSFVWGWALIWLLLGTHLFMTIRTGFIQRKIPTAIKLSVSKNDPYAEGDISQFGRPYHSACCNHRYGQHRRCCYGPSVRRSRLLFFGCGLPASLVSQPSTPKPIYP